MTVPALVLVMVVASVFGVIAIKNTGTSEKSLPFKTPPKTFGEGF